MRFKENKLELASQGLNTNSTRHCNSMWLEITITRRMKTSSIRGPVVKVLQGFSYKDKEIARPR